jgi:hypothetical protein
VVTDDDDWTSLSALGNHLNRTDPSFDPRNYGFGKLSDLVKGQSFVETKTVTGSGGGGHLWLRLKRRRGGEDVAPDAPKKTAKKAVKKATVAKKATGAAR